MSSFKFCPECGFKFDKEYKFCPECGFNLTQENKKDKSLFEFAEDTEDYGEYGGFADRVKAKQGASKNDADSLRHATILCLRGEFEEAEKLTKEYVDKYFDNVEGYVALLRVHSKDFAEFEGGQIEKDIKIITKLSKGGVDDEDYKEYIKARENYFADKKIKVEQAKKKEEAKRKADEEKKKLEEEKKKEEAILNKQQDEKNLEKALDLYKNKKYKDAFALFQAIAEHDNPEALYYLGLMYHGGYACEGNTKKAMEYYEKSAKAGYTPAMCSVAYFHHPPYSFKEEDHKQTAYWYQKAAELNDPRGQYETGNMILHGYYGVTKDVNKAIYWFQKAAAQGEKSAEQELKELKNKGNEAAAQALQAIKAKSNKKT